MITENDIKPLQPLQFGNILVVGTKASNFDEELRNHPRIIMWDSQNEHWTDKNIPTNVRAIFVTRFIGHAQFGNIIKEARKKQITIFNPQGTGLIVRQIKELLDVRKPVQEAETITTTQEETVTKEAPHALSKLHVFRPLIDFEKGNMENARILIEKSKELGVETTFASLANFIGMERKKTGQKPVKQGGYRPRVPKDKPKKAYVSKAATKDVTVEMFDKAVDTLMDLRSFFIATVKENNQLKQRLERFKKLLD